MNAASSVKVQLHAVAHARAGDKGNRLNVCLMPYDPRAYEALALQLTPERVQAAYAHRGATAVTRHDLPLLPAFMARAAARWFSRSQCNAVDTVVVPAAVLKLFTAAPARTVPSFRRSSL